MSEDQKIVPLRDGNQARVTATVMETAQLEWWLRSLGTFVEVIKPATLRKAFGANAALVAAKYL